MDEAATGERHVWLRKREGMLRPEYGDWYPWLVPGVWYRAVWLREVVVRQRQAVEPRWEAEARVPDNAHFVFRGGRTRPAGPRLTRWTDFSRPRAMGIPRPSGAQTLPRDRSSSSPPT